MLEVEQTCTALGALAILNSAEFLLEEKAGTKPAS